MDRFFRAAPAALLILLMSTFLVLGFYGLGQQIGKHVKVSCSMFDRTR